MVIVSSQNACTMSSSVPKRTHWLVRGYKETDHPKGMEGRTPASAETLFMPESGAVNIVAALS